MPLNILFFQKCNVAEFAKEFLTLNFDQKQTILLWLKYCVECLTKKPLDIGEFGGIEDTQIVYAWHGGKLFEH